MKVEVEGMLAANELLRRDKAAADAYFELLDVLQECRALRRDRPKSKPAYIFDQTALIESARSRLEGRGWTRDEMIHGPFSSAHTILAAVKADMSKARIHAIFEFGNRASYAYNTLSRYALGTSHPGYIVTAFVVPTTAFANRIDSNLATFERLVAEFTRLELALPRMIPGPLLIVGLEPEAQDLSDDEPRRPPTVGAQVLGGLSPRAVAPKARSGHGRFERSSGLTCPSCGKQFRTPNGLRWHRDNTAACRG